MTRWETFLQTYSPSVLDGGPHQVSLIIPPGKSRNDLVVQAHNVVQAVYCHPGVCESHLIEWQKSRQFMRQVRTPAIIAVEGSVPNSTNMARVDHESIEKNWNNVDIWDLASAHQAYLVLTGKDLFNNKIVLARFGALNYVGFDGLSKAFVSPTFRDNDIAASRSLRVKLPHPL